MSFDYTSNFWSHSKKKLFAFYIHDVAVFERIHLNRSKWLLARQARTFMSEEIGLVDLKTKTGLENSELFSYGNSVCTHIKIHVLGTGTAGGQKRFDVFRWWGSYISVITGGMLTTWHRYNNKEKIKWIKLQIISQ